MSKVWKAHKTLLIVGEGHSEVAFLNHIKQFPGVCGQGIAITIRNARGKGAAGVIDYTIKLQANTSFDRVAALLDTDTDWNDKVAKLARKNGIEVLTSDPCLEAFLLRLLGQYPGPAKELKKQFAPYVSNDGTSPEDYRVHFGQPVLQAARMREPTIDALLKIFNC